MEENEPRTLKSVERTCEVIDALIRMEPAGISELADELEISKGGVYNHIATLKKHNYVAKYDGKYRLSLRFLNVGNLVKHNHELYIAGEDHLKDLAKETDEYAHLMTILGGKAVYLSKARGDKGMAEEFHEKKTETTDYLHYSSAGKAILSKLPEDAVEAIVEQYGLPPETPNTITNREDLYRELETIAEQGFAINDEEEVLGTRAVGAPIEHKKTGIIGAISVSGPKSRMQGEKFSKELPRTVMNKANLIEINMNTAIDG